MPLRSNSSRWLLSELPKEEKKRLESSSLHPWPNSVICQGLCRFVSSSTFFIPDVFYFATYGVLTSPPPFLFLFRSPQDGRSVDLPEPFCLGICSGFCFAVACVGLMDRASSLALGSNVDSKLEDGSPVWALKSEAVRHSCALYGVGSVI